MTTLSLKPKYIHVLQTLGNLEELLKQAVHQYAVSKLQARINETEPNIRAFEKKYGMSYAEFQQKVSNDEPYLAQLRQIEVLWEADANEWEYNTEVLAQGIQ